MRYYHVIKRQEKWHLYADHGLTVLAADTEQAGVIRVARTLARQNGAKVVLHKEQVGAPTRSYEAVSQAGAPG